MKWKRLYKESEGEAKTLPVEVSMRELKLIQNYLTKGKPLNDPSNKECQELVIRILKGLVENADIEKLDIYVSNVLHENFGLEVDLDPYGEKSAIELAQNGLIPLSDYKYPQLCQDGEYKDLIQGGFWNPDTGILEEGFIEVEDMNLILQEMTFEKDIDTIQLKKDGKVAKLLLTFK